MTRQFYHALAALLVGAVGTSIGSAGETYFVSPTGTNGGKGTKDAPWRTIQHACDHLLPGDTAIVQEGTYNEQIYIEREGNEASGPITLKAEGKAVISAKGLDDDNVIYIEDKSWIQIIGFEICDLQTKDGSGIRFEGTGSHLEFRNNLIHGILGKNAMGITVYGTDDDSPVSNLIIDGNEIHDCDAAPSEALTLNGNVTNFEVTNNHVHDIRGVGIDFIGGEEGITEDRTKAARNGICRGNRVERVRANYGGGYGPGIYVDGGRDIVVEHNIVSECDLGIEIGAENPGVEVSGVSVIGNIITNNDKAGLAVGGYEKKRGRVINCLFHNNLIQNNTSHKKAEAEIWIQWAQNNDFRNNLIVGRAVTETPLLYSENKEQVNEFNYNLWFHPKGTANFVWAGKEFESFETYRESTGNDARSIAADPKLSPDHRPDSDSPAINGGDPLTKTAEGATDFENKPRVVTGRIDIGPFENQP